jgi:hypothetical protein
MNHQMIFTWVPWPLGWDALFVITWCVDIIFMIDMVLQFVTMYPKTTARGLELESRPWKIAKHYVMTWFFLVSRQFFAPFG